MPSKYTVKRVNRGGKYFTEIRLGKKLIKRTPWGDIINKQALKKLKTIHKRKGRQRGIKQREKITRERIKPSKVHTYIRWAYFFVKKELPLPGEIRQAPYFIRDHGAGTFNGVVKDFHAMLNATGWNHIGGGRNKLLSALGGDIRKLKLYNTKEDGVKWMVIESLTNKVFKSVAQKVTRYV